MASYLAVCSSRGLRSLDSALYLEVVLWGWVHPRGLQVTWQGVGELVRGLRSLDSALYLAVVWWGLFYPRGFQVTWQRVGE